LLLLCRASLQEIINAYRRQHAIEQRTEKTVILLLAEGILNISPCDSASLLNSAVF
jgi:hypothetical protein